MATTQPPQAERILRLLGLGYRGGKVAVGVDAVRSALQESKVACVVLAADASERARDKVERLARARGILIVPGPPAEVIGNRLGRPAVMVAGVLDRALAEGVANAAPGGAHTEE